jgi:hypothetical protein
VEDYENSEELVFRTKFGPGTSHTVLMVLHCIGFVNFSNSIFPGGHAPPEELKEKKKMCYCL